MKLLIVDDSHIIRETIQGILRGHRFTEVRQAADGVSAVASALAWNPDVVTMDITMPELDGLSAVDQITAARPRIKILIVTALADKQTAVEAVRRGAEGFVLKPFTPEDLRLALDELLD
ncbi:MAG: response regulator [Verrucomicrobia bacterium]|nr:response regulator [Verrucomicrobiota bacterium]